jgi:hypothetical protein
MLISDLSQDPYGGRVVLMLYGRPKIGKTTAILNMVKDKGQFLYIMSMDKGTMKVRQNPKSYQGKMVVAYPNDLREIRVDLSAMKERITKLVGKVGSAKVWMVVDTVTHMQDILLTESRKIDVNNPSFKNNERRQQDAGDAYLRDMGTRVDFMVNIGHMTEVGSAVLSMPCNVIFVALEKADKDRKDRPTMAPRLSGQSYGKYMGDVDAILRMDMAGENERIFQCMPTPDFEAGDRSGRLQATEPADLVAIREKMLFQESKSEEVSGTTAPPQ